ncbi:MAG: hypothetical protein LN416_09360 [Candidatus Thermoplasmatota archaeon]|nr:hypothetical protein [Candidatus Thermoplasmatota archaeon]
MLRFLTGCGRSWKAICLLPELGRRLETLDPKRGYWIQALEDVTIANAN